MSETNSTGRVAVGFGAIAAVVALLQGFWLLAIGAVASVSIFFIASKKYESVYPQALILLGSFWCGMFFPFSVRVRRFDVNKFQPLIPGDAYTLLYWLGAALSVVVYLHAAREERFSKEWINGTRIAAATSTIVLIFMGLVGLIA